MALQPLIDWSHRVKIFPPGTAENTNVQTPYVVDDPLCNRYSSARTFGTQIRSFFCGHSWITKNPEVLLSSRQFAQTAFPGHYRIHLSEKQLTGLRPDRNGRNVVKR